MKSVTALLSDLMLVNDEEFMFELRGLKSCTIVTLQKNLIRLNTCIEHHLNNIKKHDLEVKEVKQLINKYGLTIQELRLIEREMLNHVERNDNFSDISSKIVLNKLNAITNI